MVLHKNSSKYINIVQLKSCNSYSSSKKIVLTNCSANITLNEFTGCCLRIPNFGNLKSSAGLKNDHSLNVLGFRNKQSPYTAKRLGDKDQLNNRKETRNRYGEIRISGKKKMYVQTILLIFFPILVKLGSADP